jgi:hypothetical protein
MAIQYNGPKQPKGEPKGPPKQPVTFRGEAPGWHIPMAPGYDPNRGLNTPVTYQGQAAGWHPPMAPGYDPATGSVTPPAGPGNTQSQAPQGPVSRQESIFGAQAALQNLQQSVSGQSQAAGAASTTVPGGQGSAEAEWLNWLGRTRERALNYGLYPDEVFDAEGNMQPGMEQLFPNGWYEDGGRIRGNYETGSWHTGWNSQSYHQGTREQQRRRERRNLGGRGAPDGASYPRYRDPSKVKIAPPGKYVLRGSEPPPYVSGPSPKPGGLTYLDGSDYVAYSNPPRWLQSMMVFKP